MKSRKECKIIQDLLPNYIEKLTNEETNHYIEEHLKECDECRKVLENMEKELELNTRKRDNREVNYIKKFNIKFNILKIILIVILAIVMISILRKAIIMNKLLFRAKDYENIDNYYSKYYQYDNDFVTIIESYNKDEKYLRTLKNISKDTGEITDIITEYFNGETSNYYWDLIDKKIAFLDTNSRAIMPVENKPYYLYFNNSWEFIKNCIFSKVKKVNCNGIECYRFTDLYSIQTDDSEQEIYAYLDKNTGLPVRCSGQIISSNSGTYNMIIDYYYEFNTVTDEDLKEPDITRYVIQENE